MVRFLKVGAGVAVLLLVLGLAIRGALPHRVSTSSVATGAGGEARPLPTVSPSPSPTPTPTPTPAPTPTRVPAQAVAPAHSAAPAPSRAPQPAPTAMPATGTVGWSSAYYVGWAQSAHPPQTLEWKAITHLIHFSVMTGTARNGSVNTTAHGMSPAFMQAAVAAAHHNGKKILLSVGGDDDNNWDAACNSTNRNAFANNLAGLVQAYGYDGLDLDVEQDFGAPSHTDFIACIMAVRAALDTITPRRLLTEPGDPDWQASMIAPVAPYLDQVNLMSYSKGINDIPAAIARYTSQGVPSSKIGIGLGLDAGMVDTALASCQAKTALAVMNGMGLMEWIITEAQTSCLDTIARYVRGPS